MVCERESESENEDDEIPSMKEEYSVEATNVPTEFSNMLDHLSIFKRKLTGVKAVGDSSVLTEEKACQAYDVPWKDYEKCIGYSLVKKDDCDGDDDVQEEQLHPDENFGKYQEQFLFYLQHIEDFGIETEDLKVCTILLYFVQLIVTYVIEKKFKILKLKNCSLCNEF